MAKTIAWRDLKRMIPPAMIATKNESDLTVDLKNGAVIALVGADNPDSMRGITPHFVVMEECAQLDPMAWPEIVRPSITVHKARVLFITTPKGRNWFFDLWTKAGELPDWSRFQSTAYDNPYVSKVELDAAHAECRSEVIWRQEYLAEFESHGGRVIPGFNYDKHFITLPPVKPSDYMIVPVDWGQSDDTAACYLRLTDGDAPRFEVMSYYGTNGLGARQQAQLIRRRWEERKFPIDHAVLSHDAYRVDPDRKGETVAWRFIDEFDPVPVERSDKLRSARIDLLVDLAARGRLLIHKCAENQALVDQIMKLEWKDTIAQETKGQDDGVDSLGYGCMNIAYRAGLDRKIESAQTKENDEKPRTYLRGYPRDEKTPVIDEVTGYIGETSF